jgi:hypothetical protein
VEFNIVVVRSGIWYRRFRVQNLVRCSEFVYKTIVVQNKSSKCISEIHSNILEYSTEARNVLTSYIVKVLKMHGKQ